MEKQTFKQMYRSPEYRKTRVMVRILIVSFILTVISFLICFLLPRPVSSAVVLTAYILLGVFALLALVSISVWIYEFCTKMKKIKETRKTG